MDTPNAARTLASAAYASKARSDGEHAILEAWHNDVRVGTFRFCDEQPCHAIHLNSTVGRPPAFYFA